MRLHTCAAHECVLRLCSALGAAMYRQVTMQRGALLTPAHRAQETHAVAQSTAGLRASFSAPQGATCGMRHECPLAPAKRAKAQV